MAGLGQRYPATKRSSPGVRRRWWSRAITQYGSSSSSRAPRCRSCAPRAAGGRHSTERRRGATSSEAPAAPRSGRRGALCSEVKEEAPAEGGRRGTRTEQGAPASRSRTNRGNPSTCPRRTAHSRQRPRRASGSAGLGHAEAPGEVGVADLQVVLGGETVVIVREQHHLPGLRLRRLSWRCRPCGR